MRSFVVAAALVGAATAQQTYTWAGEPISMGDPDAWMGANPFDQNNLPSYSSFGTDNSMLTSSIPTGVNIDVGSRLELHGQSVIYFGNGQTGGNTMITFGNTGARTAVATFAAPIVGQSMITPIYDYSCNLNWRTGGDIPGTAPCTRDIVQIPNDNNPYFISTFGARAAASYIEPQNGAVSDRVSACGSLGQGYTVGVGSLSVVQITNCPSTFFFNRQTGYTCPQNPVMSIACGGNRANSIVTGSPGGGGGNPNTYTVITYGPFAGQVYAVQGRNFVNRTGSVTITTVTAPTDTSAGEYRIGDTVFSGVSGAAVADTPAPTPAPPPPAAASGSDGSSGGSMLLIIIIIVAVVVILVVVVVVIKKKNAQQSSAASHSAVSFENPMYDGAGPDAGSAGVAQVDQDGGLYQEPEMGATGGYMDVPAGGGDDFDEGGTSGYMDVPAQGESETGGYMDVDDEEDNDDV